MFIVAFNFLSLLFLPVLLEIKKGEPWRCVPGEMMDLGFGKSSLNFTCSEWGKNQVFFPKSHPPVPTDSVEAQTSTLSHCEISFQIPQNCASGPTLVPGSSCGFHRLVLLLSLQTQGLAMETSWGQCDFLGFPALFPLPLPSRALIPQEMSAFLSPFSHLVSDALAVWVLCVSCSSFSAGNSWLPALEYSGVWSG